MSWFRGLLDTMGELLAEFWGTRSTRLTASPAITTLVQMGQSNATIAGDGITVTVVPVLLGGVVAGRIFRLASGPDVGEEVEIDSVTPPSTIVLGDAVTPGSALSWEVLTAPATSLSVESAWEWETSGTCTVDSVPYRYASRTDVSLDDVEHWDGTSWVQGVSALRNKDGTQRAHAPLAEVLDTTGTYSAMGRTRRQFDLATATGRGLSIVGERLGWKRPLEATDDAVWRRFLQAVSHTQLDLVYALERALDALVGENQWDLLEDLTGPSDGDFRKPATIFARRGDDNPEDPNGSTYLDGFETIALTSTTQGTLAGDPISVASVVPARNGGTRRVDSGSGLIATAGTNGRIVLTGPASTFSTRILRGDLFALTGRAGYGFVYSRTSATEIILGASPGFGPPTVALGALQAWTITRDASNCRDVNPSADVSLEYDADTTGAAQWAFAGVAGATEIANVSHVTVGPANLTQIEIQNLGETAYYQHALRAALRSTLAVEVAAGWAGGLSATTTHRMQWALRLADNERMFAAGLIDDGAGEALLSLVNPSTGAAIGADVPFGPEDVIRIVRLTSDATTVNLYLDGRLVSSAAKSAFPASSDRNVRVGLQSTDAPAQAAMLLRSIRWEGCHFDEDLWAYRFAATTVAPDLIDVTGGGGSFQTPGDLGRSVRVDHHAAVNADGGSSLGEWEVIARPTASRVQVRGPTKGGATVELSDLQVLHVRGEEDAFRWPDHAGASIEIMSGPNAGVFPIAAFLHPETEEDLLDGYVVTGGLAASWATPSARRLRLATSVVRLDTVGGTPSFPVLEQQDEEVTWRLVPAFPADASARARLVDAGSSAGSVLTFRTAAAWGSGVPVEVHRTVVEGGYVRDSEDRISTSDHRAFWLRERWGWHRPVLERMMAGAFRFDPYHLVRDEAGLHITED